MQPSEIQAVKQRFGIIGTSELLNRAIDIAVQVSPTDLSVLITGESGVGKENFPQIIHHYSHRKHGPYIDNVDAGPVITILSLLSDAKLILTYGTKRENILLPSRSVIQLKGIYRTHWKQATNLLLKPYTKIFRFIVLAKYLFWQQLIRLFPTYGI